MSNINSQTKSLNDIAAVKELTNETAAAMQGGAAMTVYKHHRFIEWLGEFNKGGRAVLSPEANDQITSIRINSGKWAFYEHANYQGRVLTLGPGAYSNLGTEFGQFWNDRISSFRKVG